MTRVVIIGAGKGGRALLEMFIGDPTVTILGIADLNPWAPGLELARRLNVPVATELRTLVADPTVDLIIDVTGSPEVERDIQALKPSTTEVMGGASAKFMWDLLAERKRSEELEDRYGMMLREIQAQAEGDFIIGQNPKMKELAELIVRVAATPTTVLIRGESGTGKELVARAIHRYSNVRDRPLVTVNCTALAPTLLESELFGHKRGAFTGAVADKPGLFARADGGTIFLDEVGDMPLEMQSKLLRVLQTGEIKPVGDVVTRKVRVRVIAATNRDLEKALAVSEFREDLFYRFNTFTITLPPLRERTEDIPVLAHHFLRKAEAKVNKRVDRFAPEALDLLKRYPWPGNLRELENTIERAVVLATSRQVEVVHLPLHLQEPAPTALRAGEGFLQARARTLAVFEREAISRLLAEARGNVSVAAKRAGITRRNLHRLILKYSIKTRALRDGTDPSQ
ncbi:MAG TPA: sigma 54-interacting transcriptional regulator [Methylomirabilota bacterium]|jgi:transcriptional regulator with GAF, ATPase, and Fis domain|nr:sigma 54-interacting transcriptional regulator [Methylomirabilota bacterium]